MTTQVAYVTLVGTDLLPLKNAALHITYECVRIDYCHGIMEQLPQTLNDSSVPYEPRKQEKMSGVLGLIFPSVRSLF